MSFTVSSLCRNIAAKIFPLDDSKSSFVSPPPHSCRPMKLSNKKSLFGIRNMLSLDDITDIIIESFPSRFAGTICRDELRTNSCADSRRGSAHPVNLQNSFLFREPRAAI
jgi:hypothetical protein